MLILNLRFDKFLVSENKMSVVKALETHGQKTNIYLFSSIFSLVFVLIGLEIKK